MVVYGFNLPVSYNRVDGDEISFYVCIFTTSWQPLRLQVLMLFGPKNTPEYAVDISIPGSRFLTPTFVPVTVKRRYNIEHQALIYTQLYEERRPNELKHIGEHGHLVAFDGPSEYREPTALEREWANVDTPFFVFSDGQMFPTARSDANVFQQTTRHASGFCDLFPGGRSVMTFPYEEKEYEDWKAENE